MRKSKQPENTYLTSYDYFFNEVIFKKIKIPTKIFKSQVSTFNELIPLVVKTSEKHLDEFSSDDYDSCGKLILNVCSFLTMIAKGVELAHKQWWAVEVSQDAPTWLNQGHLFSNFVRQVIFILFFDIIFQLNKALGYLKRSGDLEEENENEIYENDNNVIDGGRISNDDSNTPIRNRNYNDDTRLILEQAVCLAKFVLSQQNRYQRDNSQVISKFYEIKRKVLALRLAEEFQVKSIVFFKIIIMKFQDFTMLIEYSLKNLNEKDCRKALEHYKQKFQAENFDLFLYDYYRKKGLFKFNINNILGMVNLLLAEKGTGLNDYLSDHKTISWIRNIENGEYKKVYFSIKKNQKN